MRINILVFILAVFIGFTAYTTVYAYDDAIPSIVQTEPSTGITESSCTPTQSVSPTLILPIPTDEEISDTPSPTAGDSATPTPQPFPGPTEGSGGYFNDNLGCGTHSCVGKPGYVPIPTSAPSTGRASN